MTKNRLLITCALGAAALFTAVYFGSPFAAALSLKNANEAKLERLVNFERVRANLKERLTAQIATQVTNDPEMASNPFAGFAVLMAEGIVSNLVETHATPAKVAEAIRSGDGNPDAKYGWRYVTVDDFEVSVDEVDLVFERTGIYDWRVVDVVMPLEAK
jgi:hypothetical protein